MTGKTLLHLQCATGEDTLSWVVAGARATGVDLSEVQITLAQQKARDAGLDVRFLASDIYTLPAEFQQGTFDVVSTGRGALVWLPDLTRWAQIIAAALKPNGKLILFEEHPLAQCLSVVNNTIRVEGRYFGRSQPDSIGQGWTHFKGGEDARETKYEFSWPLGDVVTTLAQAGMRIERLQEYPSQAQWRFGEMLDTVGELPGEYLLVASKEKG